MKNGLCCSQNSKVTSTGYSWTGVVRQTASWVLPGVVLAAMPKCPLCLVGYFALFTGLGFSLTAATFAWWFVAVGCIAALTCVFVTTCIKMLRLYLSHSRDSGKGV